MASALLEAAPSATRCILGAHCALSVVAALSRSVLSPFLLTVVGVKHGSVFSLASYWLVTVLGPSPLLGLLTLMLSGWAALVYFAQLEREHGTVRFLAWLVVGSMTIGAVFLATAFLIAQFDPKWAYMPCYGLWPPLVLAMTQRALVSPDATMVSLWGVMQIPARWYPLALIGFFSLLSMQLQVDLFAAWFVAIAAHQADGGQPLHPALARIRLPLHLLLPSSAAVARLEEEGTCGSGHVLGAHGDGLPAANSMRWRLCSLPREVAWWFARSCPPSLRSLYVCMSSATGRESGAFGGGLAKASLPGDAGTLAGGAGGGSTSGRSFVPFSGSGYRLGQAGGDGEP